MAGRNFMDRHEDFPQNERAVEALQARAVGLIRANQFGTDISETLDIAYSQLVAEGVIKPDRDETYAPPPRLTGSTGVNSVVDPEQLNDADLKTYMRSRGMNV